MSTDLRVGAYVMSLDVARFYVTRYLTNSGRKTASFPAYEGFQRDHDPDVLSDADLLAPVLLNAKLSLDAYYGLQRHRTRLEERLREIKRDAALDQPADPTALLGPLFAVLDGEGIPGVRGSVLSKVLHRKRPGFIPLYDRRARWCYRDAPGAPISPGGRSWEALAVLLADAMRRDLVAQSTVWRELASIVHPAITPLRALDIIAAHAGRQCRGIRLADDSDAGERVASLTNR